MERLLARNDAIAGSPHPLRRTLERTMATPSGRPAKTSADRYEFVRHVHLLAGEGRLADLPAAGGRAEGPHTS